MSNETKTIENGTAVICQTGGSHFMFGQVVDTIKDEWGTHYEICITLKSTEEKRVVEFKKVSSISNEDMKGIGWKLATVQEQLRIAHLVKFYVN